MLLKYRLPEWNELELTLKSCYSSSADALIVENQVCNISHPVSPNIILPVGSGLCLPMLLLSVIIYNENSKSGIGIFVALEP